MWLALNEVWLLLFLLLLCDWLRHPVKQNMALRANFFIRKCPDRSDRNLVQPIARPGWPSTYRSQGGPFSTPRKRQFRLKSRLWNSFARLGWRCAKVKNVSLTDTNSLSVWSPTRRSRPSKKEIVHTCTGYNHRWGLYDVFEWLLDANNAICELDTHL